MQATNTTPSAAPAACLVNDCRDAAIFDGLCDCHSENDAAFQCATCEAWCDGQPSGEVDGAAACEDCTEAQRKGWL